MKIFNKHLLLFVLLTITTALSSQSYGAKISKKGAISYDELLTKIAIMDTVHNVKVIGTVANVCQMKGCWMTIQSSHDSKPEMTVSFKDYAFFMPSTLSGEVVIRGFAYKEITTIEELQHNAREDGLLDDEVNAITEPLVEILFEADGVLEVK